jgi:osmotically-inducible protein OsmY
MAKGRKTFLSGLLVGTALEYLFDPRQGRRRRAVGRDWTAARIRGGLRRLRRRLRYAGSQARGRWQRLSHARDAREQPDDATLAHKVETELFRDSSVPKGQILVNAERGIVYLRGEVPDASMLEMLVARTREVQGVRAVESLLHLPGEPAPAKQR